MKKIMLRDIKKVHCPHCGHVFLAPDIEDRATVKAMDVHCPKCGALVNPEGFIPRVLRFADDLLKAAGKLTLVVLMFGMMTGCAPKFLRDGVTPDEMSRATTATDLMSPAEILQAFRTDGVSDDAVADYFHASRYVIARLREGETMPTPSMEATLRGAYTNYLLLGKSFKWLARKCPTDQYYAFPNPLMEIDADNS